MSESNPQGGRKRWGNGQNSTLSEYDHVAYPIKGNDARSNMVANILARRHALDPVDGAKSSKHVFPESYYVAYQIKGNEV